MSATVYQGAVAPENYSLALTPGTSGVDLSTVSAASFLVRLPNGTTTTWAATMSNQTTTTLTLSHTFLTNDVALAGIYEIYASLTIPSGTVRSKTVRLIVRAKFEES